MSPFDAVPSPPPGKPFWVHLRYHASGYETTHYEKTAMNLRMLISVVSAYAEVVEQGEVKPFVHESSVAGATDESKPSF